jgi:hypothetical protein
VRACVGRERARDDRTCSVPKPKVDWFSIHHHIRRVIVKDGRDIFAREGVGCVRNQQARLPDGTIPHDNTLNGLEWCGVREWVWRERRGSVDNGQHPRVDWRGAGEGDRVGR